MSQSRLQLTRTTAGNQPLQRSRTGGRPLPEAVREQMERRFQQDFSEIRIHEDQTARSLNATAYTRGTHLHFAPGKYSPQTHLGQRTLAHELAHVVQQRAGRVARPASPHAPVNVDPVLEAEADTAGQFLAGGNAAVGTDGDTAQPAADVIQRNPNGEDDDYQDIEQQWAKGERSFHDPEQAARFIKSHRVVQPHALTPDDDDGGGFDAALAPFTGPITYAADQVAQKGLPKMKQHLKALVPWSHKRKNWMRAANLVEGATDIGYNSASLGAEAMTAGLSAPATAGIGTGYKTAFSLGKSRIRRESKQRAGFRAASVAVSEFGQGMIPVAGSAWGIGSGLKQVVETGDLDRIAPERHGDRRVLRILDDRIAEADRRRKAVGIDPKTKAKLDESHEWLSRQREKSQRRFERIDAKKRG